MDYLLPDSETMERLAKEYAKIKRLSLPNGGSVSAFNQDETAVPANVGQNVEEPETTLTRRTGEMQTSRCSYCALDIATIMLLISVMK